MCKCGEDKLCGRGMCKKCYMQWYRDTHPEFRARMAEKERNRRKKLGDKYLEDERKRGKIRKDERTKYNKTYYQKNAEKLKQYQKDYRKREREKIQFSWRVTKQRRRGILVTLTKKQWEQIVLFYCPINQCLACGELFDDTNRLRRLTMDHIIPMNQGGQTTADNVQPLCFSCNASKSDRNVVDYRPDKGEFACQLK